MVRRPFEVSESVEVHLRLRDSFRGFPSAARRAVYSTPNVASKPGTPVSPERSRAVRSIRLRSMSSEPPFCVIRRRELAAPIIVVHFDDAVQAVAQDVRELSEGDDCAAC